SRQDQTGTTDIWMLDVARGVSTRFTFDPASELGPIWSPDNSRIAFGFGIGRDLSIYQKESSGSGNQKLLLNAGNSTRPLDWSSDGKYLLYAVFDSKTKSDLWVLPDPSSTERERKPIPYLQTPFNEVQGQFRPTTVGGRRWIAYTSDESGAGQYHIYVQSF